MKVKLSKKEIKKAWDIIARLNPEAVMLLNDRALMARDAARAQKWSETDYPLGCINGMLTGLSIAGAITGDEQRLLGAYYTNKALGIQ